MIAGSFITTWLYKNAVEFKCGCDRNSKCSYHNFQFRQAGSSFRTNSKHMVLELRWFMPSTGWI